MLDCEKTRNDKAGKKVVEALKSRLFDAWYVETKEEALKKVLELIPEGDSVSWGGSYSMAQIGVFEALKKGNYKLIDRDTAKTPEERNKLMHDALSCGTFLMSSNAITQDGQLFNIDGMANRVAALCFGPRNVIIVAGMNKVVKDMDAAYSRVRNFAAPVNSQRFDIETPCKLTGECADCKSPSGICNQFVTTRMCKPQGRIKVILVGETLGI